MSSDVGPIHCDPADWIPTGWGVPRQRDLAGEARMAWLDRQIAMRGGWKGHRCMCGKCERCRNRESVRRSRGKVEA